MSELRLTVDHQCLRLAAGRDLQVMLVAVFDLVAQLDEQLDVKAHRIGIAGKVLLEAIFQSSGFPLAVDLDCSATNVNVVVLDPVPVELRVQ